MIEQISQETAPNPGLFLRRSFLGGTGRDALFLRRRGKYAIVVDNISIKIVWLATQDSIGAVRAVPWPGNTARIDKPDSVKFLTEGDVGVTEAGGDTARFFSQVKKSVNVIFNPFQVAVGEQEVPRRRLYDLPVAFCFSVTVAFDGDHRYSQIILQLVGVVLIIAAVKNQINLIQFFPDLIYLVQIPVGVAK